MNIRQASDLTWPNNDPNYVSPNTTAHMSRKQGEALIEWIRKQPGRKNARVRTAIQRIEEGLALYDGKPR